MRVLHGVVTVMGLAVAACDPAGTGPDATASPTAAPDKRETGMNAPPAGAEARHDLAKPYLTETRVGRLIDSMGEAQSPLNFLFTETGAARSPEALEAKKKEFDTFARKYGFQDYEDYMYTWGRIEAARIAESNVRTLRQSTEDRIRLIEEQLRAQDLSEEKRRAAETQLDGVRRDLEEIRRREMGGLNEADAALVRKYGAQFDDALRRYRRNP